MQDKRTRIKQEKPHLYPVSFGTKIDPISHKCLQSNQGQRQRRTKSNVKEERMDKKRRKERKERQADKLV